MEQLSAELILALIAALTGIVAIIGLTTFVIHTCLSQRNMTPTDRSEDKIVSNERTPSIDTDDSPSQLVYPIPMSDNGSMVRSQSGFDDAWSYAMTEEGSVLVAKQDDEDSVASGVETKELDVKGTKARSLYEV